MEAMMSIATIIPTRGIVILDGRAFTTVIIARKPIATSSITITSILYITKDGKNIDGFLFFLFVVCAI